MHPPKKASRDDGALDVLDGHQHRRRPVKRITFALYDGQAPKTTQNFLMLCTGEKGIGETTKKANYRHSTFHRVIPGFMPCKAVRRASAAMAPSFQRAGNARGVAAMASPVVSTTIGQTDTTSTLSSCTRGSARR